MSPRRTGDAPPPAVIAAVRRSAFAFGRDFQEMAGAFNSKRAYLAKELRERLGVTRWASETHVMAALWSAEVLHSLRLRTESFRSLCPDGPEAFEQWWSGDPPTRGATSTL